MTEFERIESMRRAHYEESELLEARMSSTETDNERAIRFHESRLDSRDMRDQTCGGGRRVIRKKIGGD